jgi:predicted nuclease of predicted toxin-antitoxin system
LVDENLGSAKLPGILRKAGFPIVTHKTKYKGKQGIPDPQIIADCGKNNLVLLTGDGRLETLWAAEIQKARIAVVILTNNTDGAPAWGARLAAGKQDILMKLRKYEKPCALRFGVNAKVTIVRLYGPKRAKLIKM